MTNVSDQESLPTWFNRENYQAAKDFGSAEWLACLRIRKNILDTFSAFKSAGYYLSFLDEIMPEARDELCGIRLSPLALLGGDNWAAFIGDFRGESMALPLRTMNFSDLVNQWRNDRLSMEIADDSQINRDRWEMIEKWPNIPTEIMGTPFSSKKQILASLMVDMRATDAVLIETFKTWLKDSREKQQSASGDKPSAKKPAYRSWSRYGLLAYLDLYIWSKEKGITITHHDMALAVGYAKGGDSFRKTVVKLAKNLMQDLSQLEALAASEASPETFQP